MQTFKILPRCKQRPVARWVTAWRHTLFTHTKQHWAGWVLKWIRSWPLVIESAEKSDLYSVSLKKTRVQKWQTLTLWFIYSADSRNFLPSQNPVFDRSYYGLTSSLKIPLYVRRLLSYQLLVVLLSGFISCVHLIAIFGSMSVSVSHYFFLFSVSSSNMSFLCNSSIQFTSSLFFSRSILARSCHFERAGIA
jgi:hypothetical protein